MNNLDRVKSLNKNIDIFTVNDDCFKVFGAVINGLSLDELIDVASKTDLPEAGNVYVGSYKPFESLSVKDVFQNEIFGETQIQMGFCNGHGFKLNGLEYHKSSEVFVAVTDSILLLGLVTDINNNEYDSKNVKAFFVEKGTCLELYATTLHFAPCRVLESGFKSVIILPKYTNDDLEKPSKNSPTLFKNNKWLLAHKENEVLKGRGAYPGIFGENLSINID